jgi:hypothetical protein
MYVLAESMNDLLAACRGSARVEAFTFVLQRCQMQFRSALRSRAQAPHEITTPSLQDRTVSRVRVPRAAHQSLCNGEARPKNVSSCRPLVKVKDAGEVWGRTSSLLFFFSCCLTGFHPQVIRVVDSVNNRFECYVNTSRYSFSALETP